MSDPTHLDCGGPFVAVGIGEPTEDSYHATREEAAASYAAALSTDSRVPPDALVVDVTSPGRVFEGLSRSERTFAVRADGKTVALLGLDSRNGRWVVGSDVVC